MTDIAINTLSAIGFVDLPQAETLNPALSAAYYREHNRAEVRRSHHFGGRYENIYVSADRLPELAPVREFALSAAAQMLGRESLHHGFWFNEMQPGQRTTLHTHEEHDELLSAVYYLSCTANSGRLILHDDDALISVTPRPGLLVLFPPDLPHEVEENASDQVRLSIAFNFGPARRPTGS